MLTELVINSANRIAKSILTPISFGIRTGHYRNTLTGKAEDIHGNPIPMYTYPAVEFLQSKTDAIASMDILEWGAGQSTFWWEQRAKSVTSVERNPKWARYVRQEVTLESTEIITPPDDSVDVVSGVFDLIVVDAEPRIEAAARSLNLLSNRGIIIVDNSDLDDLKPINVRFAEKGLERVDFYGHSPAAFYRQCTSFYFFASSSFFDATTPIKSVSPHTGHLDN